MLPDTVIEIVEFETVLDDEEITISTVETAEMEVLEVQWEGIKGDPGPPGSPGAAGVGYVHEQVVPAATWTVQHNLNGKPAMVLFVNPDLSAPVYTTVSYPDLNTVVVEWPSAESGWAYAR